MTRLLFAPPDLVAVLSLTGLPGGSNKIQDRSAYGNNGTIIGATWVRLSSGLWCLSFDGQDDYVELTSNPVGDYPFTLSGWINHTSGDRSLVSLARSDVTDVWWHITIGSDLKPVLEAKNTSTEWFAGSVVDEGWHHLAGVFASATSRELFVDGASVGTDTVSVAYSPTNIRVRIGGLGDQTPQYLNALIALVRIHKRALNALEIQNRYNQEKHLFGVC